MVSKRRQEKVKLLNLSGLHKGRSFHVRRSEALHLVTEAVGSGPVLHRSRRSRDSENAMNIRDVRKHIVDVMEKGHFQQIKSFEFKECLIKFRGDIEKCIRGCKTVCIGCNRQKKIAGRRSIQIMFRHENVKCPYFAVNCCQECGNSARTFFMSKLDEFEFNVENFSSVKEMKEALWGISESVKGLYVYPRSRTSWIVAPLPDILVCLNDSIKQLTCPMAISCKIVRTKGVGVQNPAGRALSGHVMVVMNEGLQDLLKSFPNFKGEDVLIKKSWYDLESRPSTVKRTQLVDLIRYYEVTSHPAFENVDFSNILNLGTEVTEQERNSTDGVDEGEVKSGSILYTLATNLANPRIGDMLTLNRSTNKVNEFKRERGWLSKMFPHLFPYGTGDLTLVDPDPHPRTLREYFKYLITQTPDSRFAADAGFVFYVWDSMRRIELCKTVNWAMREVSGVDTVEQSDGTVRCSLSPEVRKKTYRAIHKRLSKSPLNWQYWAQERVEIVDAVHQFGLPTVFFTVSCADYHWPDLAEYLQMRTGNENISVNNLREYVGQYAGLVDAFFTEKMSSFSKRFLEEFMGAKEVFYRYEWQKRGTAHIHGLAWVPGFQASSREEGNRRLIEEYDKWVTALRPNTESVDRGHSCKNVTDMDRLSDNEYVKKELEELIADVQCHECNSYCQLGKVKCRFGLEGSKPLRGQSAFVTVENRLKFECERNDSRIASYCAPALILLRCNISMEVVADIGDVAAYVTKYILKNERGSELFAATIRAALEDEFNGGLFSKLKKDLIRLQNNRDVSLAECYHNILSLPFVCKTWIKVKVDLSDETNEIKTGFKDSIGEEDDDSEKETVVDGSGNMCRAKVKLEDYLSRPKEAEDLTLVDFFTKYWKTKSGSWNLYSSSCKTRLVVASYRSPVYETEFHTFENSDFIKEGLLLVCKYRAVSEICSGVLSWREALSRYCGGDQMRRRLFFSSSTDKCNPNEAILRRAVLTEDMITQLENEYVSGEAQIEVVEEVDQLGNVYGGPHTPVFDDDVPDEDLNEYRPVYTEIVQSLGVVGDASNGCSTGISVSKKLRKVNVGKREVKLLEGTPNSEQGAFLDFVMQHASSRKRPIYLILHAAAGTGKSFCIRLLKDQLGDRMLVTATTGIAATVIGGETVHSVLRLFGRDMPVEDGGVEIVNRFRGVEYLFIDEFSMLDCELLAQIDENLREAFSSDDDFGGISIILSGDTAQLPPVGGVSLFGRLTVRQDEKPRVVKGKDIFDKRFRNGFILSQNMRIRSGEVGHNGRFRVIVEKLRTMERLSTEEQDLLRSREATEITARQELKAMHIFDNNVDRETMMAKLCRIFEALGEKVVTFVAIHVSGNALRSQFHRQLRIYRGMRVMLLSNLNVKMGLANGAVGSVWFVSERTDIPLVYVKFDSVLLPKDWPLELGGCVPITSMGDCARGRSNVFVQLPLTSASAITTYKCQGQTAETVVLHNCNSWPASHKYVSISRVVSFEGLFFRGSFMSLWQCTSGRRQNVIDAENFVRNLMNSIST